MVNVILNKSHVSMRIYVHASFVNYFFAGNDARFQILTYFDYVENLSSFGPFSKEIDGMSESSERNV